MERKYMKRCVLLVLVSPLCLKSQRAVPLFIPTPREMQSQTNTITLNALARLK
jgi:hypothetical protein